MTCQSRKLILLFLLVLLNLTCFKKQSHDIVKPEFPNYTLTIHIENIDSGEPMENVNMVIDSKEGIFATSHFEGLSDSSGLLVFNKVYTDLYSFKCLINGVLVIRDGFYVGFRDTTLTLKLPGLSMANKIYLFRHSDIKWQYGLFWKDANTLATLGSWKPDKESKESYVRLFEGDLGNGLNVIGAKKFDYENPEMTGLVWLTPNYYSITGGFDNATFCILDRSSGKMAGQFPAPHRLADLASDGEFILATSTDYKIFKLSRSSPTPVGEFPSPGKHPTAIAFDGKNIWSYDEGTNWIYCQGSDGKIIKTLALGFYDEKWNNNSNVSNVSHMAFNYKKNLYIPFENYILVYDSSNFY